MPLHLDEANQAIAAALAKAAELHIRISASVCDENGRLVAHQRMDGAYAEASNLSVGRAVGAAGGGARGSIEPKSADHPRTATVEGEGITVVQDDGGIPIFDASNIVGGLGVSGASRKEQDAECARAGVAALERRTP